MKALYSILDAIGNTPLVRLNRITRGLQSEILVELEYYNPTGSHKDRMALAMIDKAEKEGKLKHGYTVIEYTGGSTVSSLAFVCAVKEEDAKQMARRLTREEGIFSGTSTGANVVASMELAKRSKSGSKIVTVAVDTGLKYLWTEPYLEDTRCARDATYIDGNV